MDYLKLFDTHSGYTESKDIVPLANVSRCLEENGTHYQPKYYGEYFTLVPLEDCSFSFTKDGMEYSLDGGNTWDSLESGASIDNLSLGSKVLFRASGLTPTETDGIGIFSSTGDFNVRGNIMSLVNGDDFRGTSEISDYQFCRLFSGCTGLVDAHKLYLPTTNLTESCYRVMFAYCTSLKATPRLMATSLAENCYRSMFQGSGIERAPELPATTLADYCYVNMFRECVNLKECPKLPATTLGAGCYGSMFDGCTSIKSCSEFHNTAMTESACTLMYRNCTNLINAPKLDMEIANQCFNRMFQGCTSLQRAPELPATTLLYGCYWQMFDGCTKLKHVKMLATDVSASRCLTGWLNDVSPTGIFIKSKDAAWNISGINGIPNGWKVATE